MTLCEHLDKWLITGWRQAHRLWSVRLSLLASAVSLAMDYWPSLSAYIPPHIAPAIFFLIFIARMVGQNGVV